MSMEQGLPDAGYRLRFTSRDAFLQVEVSGDIDAQAIRIAYWREIAAEGRARGAKRLLVTDRRKGVPATPEELAELALLFREEGRYFQRVGVVEPTLEFLSRMEHAEILGRSVGLNVRIFGDHDEAERWVRYGSADD